MSRPQPVPPPSPVELARRCEALRRRNDWEPLAAMAALLPDQWDEAWLEVAETAAFALGQLRRFADARGVLERAFAVRPSHRTASGLAFLHYQALLARRSGRAGTGDAEAWRKGFERWIAEALRLRPDSVQDHYRLGVYHATVRTAADTAALAAFRRAIALFESRPAERRTPRDRHWKTYVRALYAAARSAYRLRRYAEARRWIFQCIRCDAERHHVAPVFKFFLAAKVLVAEGRFADAERGLRLALEQPHRGERDFVYALLAEIALAQGRAREATDWIDLHVPAHRRKPYLWRLLGDAALAANAPRDALRLYRNALLRDRAGRHKTLVQMGLVYEQLGDRAAARRAYEQALAFRRRHYLSEDPAARAGLTRVASKGANDGRVTASER